MSYKNLNGEQMLTIFTKKFFTNRNSFKELFDSFLTEDPIAFETRVKGMLFLPESDGPKRPLFGFKSHLKLT